MKSLQIYTDGGSRGNPGPAGIGVIIKDNNRIFETAKKFIGIATNNEAEYQALILALQLAQKYYPQKINLFLDSELIVRQMIGVYRIKQPHLQKLASQVKKLEKNFEKVEYQHVVRENNKEADKLVNEAINESKKQKNNETTKQF